MMQPEDPTLHPSRSNRPSRHSPIEMTDKELVSGCLNGEVAAQRQLYARFAGRMMGICMRYATCEAEAEDIMQEGFIQIFRKMDSFKGDGALGGWVRRIMINCALQNYRKSKYLRLAVEHDEALLEPDTQHDVLSQLGAAELMKLIQQLPDGYRMVFNLYAIEGYTHKEIAEELAISVNTSKSQFSRARALLRKLIQDHAPDWYEQFG